MMRQDHSTYFLFFMLTLLISSCASRFVAKTADFPVPVDTKTKPIQVQEKRTYYIEEIQVSASNEFDGARLNGFEYVNDSTVKAIISPENTPINSSAYYAFEISSREPLLLNILFTYTHHKHRYRPKIKKQDSDDWVLVDSTHYTLIDSGKVCHLKLMVNSVPTVIASLEVTNSTDVTNWCQEKANHPDVGFRTIGKSKMDRDLIYLEIGKEPLQKKDAIVLLSRQHPPEVTGYMALQAFIDEILADTPLSNHFRKKYRVLIYPLMNPDGVDMGHWRHNAGGIDLNRDWAYYHQPEVETIANHIVRSTATKKNKVILGIDFHSTKFDIFYTNKSTYQSELPGFKDYWLDGIAQALQADDINDKSSNVGKPVSKAWFFSQFNAEGITVEIGDETPRELIKEKGRISAQEMMQLLIFK